MCCFPVGPIIALGQDIGHHNTESTYMDPSTQAFTDQAKVKLGLKPDNKLKGESAIQYHVETGRFFPSWFEKT